MELLKIEVKNAKLKTEMLVKINSLLDRQLAMPIGSVINPIVTPTSMVLDLDGVAYNVPIQPE